MKVRKFCLCGVKLERECCDEDSARQAVEMFRLAHAGSGHGPANHVEYNRIIKRLIGRRAQRAGAEFGPLEKGR